MKRAFYDKLGDDIRTGNFETTFDLIDEIKGRICAAVPRRTDIHLQLDESLDVPYFRQMVKHDAFEQSHIKSVMGVIIDKIKELGSERDEPFHEIFRTQVEVRFLRGETLDVILVFFFREALSRVDKLEHDIEAFKNSEMYKMLVEQRERNEFLKERS
jgi:hypothetical protein